MKNSDLNNNMSDYITSIVSGSLGCIPFIGSALSELTHTIIPMQRQDRIVNFISELSDDLNELKFDVEKLKIKFENIKYGEFLYKTMRFVTNEVYDEKIRFYKKLCIDGLTSDEKIMLQNERLLNILESMDYYEILYLQFYHNATLLNNPKLEEIRSKLGFLSLQPQYIMGNTNQQNEEETFKQITIVNLLNKGLLVQEYKMVGTQSREHLKISRLGRLILKKIGVISNE